ncbi:hypothetical protein Pcinc_017687 [Petrolisthes cinctipes]|uniref:Uncharacterized protein n=1 Tax=Petrolisthes cinctipes TaxID=88211 RepID=A0AAE1FPL8_PETCI|nr:hypothetical protein Pcinc_017687 [Petrolisthes cinctipes]
MPQQSDTRRHHPAVRLDSDKMQCANIFFILSIGFAPAVLAVGQSGTPFGANMKIISQEMSYSVSTGEGIIRNKFELEKGEAANVNCPLIQLRGRPQDYELVISDELTGDELYSTRQGNLKENMDYSLRNAFAISLITKSDRPLPQAAAPKVKCLVTRMAPLPPGQNDEESP